MKKEDWLDDDGCWAGPGNKKQDIQNILNVKSGYQRRSAWKSDSPTRYQQLNVLMFQLFHWRFLEYPFEV